jgi:hypothetical protein
MSTNANTIENLITITDATDNVLIENEICLETQGLNIKELTNK